MKLFLAYSNSSDSDVMVGVFSTREKARKALVREFEMTPGEAAAMTVECEHDQLLGSD